jgi:hypothetical protein
MGALVEVFVNELAYSALSGKRKVSAGETWIWAAGHGIAGSDA